MLFSRAAAGPPTNRMTLSFMDIERATWTRRISRPTASRYVLSAPPLDLLEFGPVILWTPAIPTGTADIPIDFL